MRLILASASPRRADLLRHAGFSFEVRVADVDERVLAGESPRAYVRRLAHEKASRVLAMLNGPADAGPHISAGPHTSAESPVRTNEGHADVLVVAADTSVIVDGQILGKPADADEAARMLRQLSGRVHSVLTGLCVRSSRFSADAVEETLVEFSPLSEAQIEWYVATREGLDKAGAYAIQGLASRFIPRIDGSYTNVVGLPVARVDELVRAAQREGRAVASGR